MLPESALLLPLIPLVSRGFRRCPWWEDDAWRARVDLPLTAASGLIGAWAWAWVFARPYTGDYPLTASDFPQYCELVAHVLDGTVMDHATSRSALAALLPALLARSLGIVEGLTVHSLLSLTLLCAGLFLWARVLAGRTAGIAAVLLAATMAPVTVLARDISFYPLLTALNVLLAAGVAACVRSRGPLVTLLTGLCAAAVLLADVRGVLWALPLGGMAVAAALLRGRDLRSRLLRLATLLLPILASWWVGRVFMPPQTTGLERQTAHYVEEALRMSGLDAGAAAGAIPPEAYATGFVWGRSSPARLPGALLHALQLSEGLPEALANAASVQGVVRTHLSPWLPTALVSLLLAAASLLRRPWRLAALLLTLMPFAIMLQTAARVLPQVRFLAISMVALALPLALGFAFLLEAPLPRWPWPRATSRWPWRAAVGLAILAGVVVVSNLRNARDPERTRALIQSDPRGTIEAVLEGTRDDVCAQALLADLEAGKAVEPRFFSPLQDEAPSLPETGSGARSGHPRPDAQPCSAADILFQHDARWLGGDAAFSVPLDRGRVLWLLGDSFIALTPERRRTAATMVRNAVAVQVGRDPRSATLSFHWGGTPASPASFLPEDGDRWYWPWHGVRIGRALVLFWTRMRPKPEDALGFEAEGYRVAIVDDASGDPASWKVRLVEAPEAPAGILAGAALVREGGYVVSLAVREPGDHQGYLVRWPERDLAAGRLSSAEWWAGTRGFVPLAALEGEPTPILEDAGAESSLHFDAALQRWVHVRTEGFGASTIVVSFADRITGPWSRPVEALRPPESERADAFVYAAKAHPELSGCGLAVTYVANTREGLGKLVSDEGIYFPRFVALRWGR
jgi:hypothetical protein